MQRRAHLVILPGLGAAAAADIWWTSRGGPSVLALTIAASSAWVVVRDWPVRAHYLCSVCAGLAGAVLRLGVRTDAEQAQWFAWFLLLTSVALVVEGLIDHWLIVRESRRSRPRTDHADAL
jgi:hypothetical protein